MNVFEELEKVGLPRDQFMVLGSGILGVLGIRDIADVDLLVTTDLFNHLRDNGWKYEMIEIGSRPREKISNGPIEAFKDFWWGSGTLDPETVFAGAEMIDGIRFLPLRILLEVKKSMAREKDLKDVTLIEVYLSTFLRSSQAQSKRWG